MEGTVFNIQPFSVQDGPGIRTTVFFKGCNLRCAWCHNPESWSGTPEVQQLPEKCIGCGACAAVCPHRAHRWEEGVHTIDRTRCTGCGACTAECFAGGLTLTGRTLTADEVMTRLLEDKLYFQNSGGGVTFSGGEAMLQLPFLKELLTRCRAAGIHTAVDTAGHLPFSAFEEILPFTDLFLYDIKAIDPDVHRRLTGVDNRHILDNLPRLLERGATAIVRVPCVPGGNWEEMPAIARYLQGKAVERVELLAYHRLGEGKRRGLGLCDLPFNTPAAEEMEALLQIFVTHHIPAVYTR